MTLIPLGASNILYFYPFFIEQISGKNRMILRSICVFNIGYPFIVSKLLPIFSLFFQPKLTMPKCQMNVDAFLDACRRIGVEKVRAIHIKAWYPLGHKYR